MRDYSKVCSGFWTGETGRLLRGDPLAQVVALYLVTGPNAHPLGLYYISKPAMAHAIGCSLEGASKGLARAIQGGFCFYDDHSDVVWIPEMAKYQVGEKLSGGDKRRTWARDEALRFPKCKYIKDFYARYGESYGLEMPAKKTSPSEGASKPHRSQEQEQEQEKDSKSDVTPPPSVAPPKPPKPPKIPKPPKPPKAAEQIALSELEGKAGDVLVDVWNKASDFSAENYPDAPVWVKFDSRERLGGSWPRVKAILASTGSIEAFRAEINHGIRYLLRDFDWWNNKDKNPYPSIFMALGEKLWGERVMKGMRVKEELAEEDRLDAEHAKKYLQLQTPAPTLPPKASTAAPSVNGAAGHDAPPAGSPLALERLLKENA